MGNQDFAIENLGVTSLKSVVRILIAGPKAGGRGTKKSGGVGNKPNRIKLLFINNILQK